MFEDVVGKVVEDETKPHWSYIYKAEEGVEGPEWVSTNVITTTTDHRSALVGYYYEKLKKDVRKPNETEKQEIIYTIFTSLKIKSYKRR
jgi:hypothetical protein